MGKLGGCLLLKNFPSCRSQPHQPEAVRQVWAATPENSRCKISSTNQSENQTLTLAEIKVHVMFVVSNLWMSFEKQSAWKTDRQAAWSQRHWEAWPHSAPERMLPYRPGASLWGQYFLRDKGLAQAALNRRKAKPVSSQRCPVSSCSFPIYLVLSSCPKGCPAHNTFMAGTCLLSMQQQQKKEASAGQSNWLC